MNSNFAWHTWIHRAVFLSAKKLQKIEVKDCEKKSVHKKSICSYFVSIVLL